MNMIKINIFSPGRFHVCDLARELDKNGFDVKFYSFVSAKRAEKIGLPIEKVKELRKSEFANMDLHLQEKRC